MNTEAFVFSACAVIVLGGALGVVWSRNPVHAALSLVATLFGVAVLFLNENAQLLAAVQVIVYTGAIVVLILFVIMLLGVDREEDIEIESLVGQRTVGALVGVAIVVVVVGLFIVGGAATATGQRNCADLTQTVSPRPSPFAEQCVPLDSNTAVVADRPNVNQLGRVLFTDFAFAFEITAGLLTIAVVGAVVLARRPRDYEPLPALESMDEESSPEREVTDA